MQRLLSATEYERDRAIILCLLDTGCRAGEFLSWTGGSVDTKLGTVKVMGKRRKERMVYLGAKSLKALLRYFIERFIPVRAEMRLYGRCSGLGWVRVLATLSPGDIFNGLGSKWRECILARAPK